MSHKSPAVPPIPSCWCTHDDHWFLGRSIRSFASVGPATVFLSRVAWDGTEGCWERSAEVAQAAGAEVVLGDWPSETLHRRMALQAMKERGHAHVLIPDGDEVVEPGLLDKLVRIAHGDIAGAVRVHMATYWKSARYVVRPPETLAPILLLDARVAVHDYIRDYGAQSVVVLGAEHGVLHHLSYAGPDERILRKISTWGHRDEVASDWYRKVWNGWDRDPLMRNLHPTHPTFYGSFERIPVPSVLEGVWDGRVVAEDPEVQRKWPKVSVVIPLHGGPEDIAHCLDSLEASQDLIHEIVVVDDASPDDAASIVESRLSTCPKLKLLVNELNQGFAATCNRGYEESTGRVVVFLNSDTRVPRAGFVRLVETLTSSGSIGAAGPLTNHAGYEQQIDPTYTEVGRLDLFAKDFAGRDAEDRDVTMLVGFCLAVRRSVIEELGGTPFDERFGRGLYEDTDLCYRILRAGYRLRLATRSYVHHEGSKSLARLDVHPHVLLRKNLALYQEKWRADIESGFASHLPSQSAEPIVFREDRHPDRIRKQLKELARLADISLCMIVKNEERVLGDCLESVRDVFSQVIVVDTGSTDRTREIALEHGAELYDFPWTNSFSEARNESLKHAKGKFIFWLDADDTLPATTALAVLQAAINAPREVVAYIVPVQFLDGGPGSGTRVDHVKLFRNLAGIGFNFHIHEQIVPALRRLGGRIDRIDLPVLHSGYDSSVEGQKQKRERDWPLLLRDLKENPDHPFILFNCGMTCHFEGRQQEAIAYLEQCISVSDSGESHLRKAYSLLGVAHRLTGDHAAALETFLTGLAAVGEDPELRFEGARSLESLERYEEAIEMYLAVVPSTDGHFSSMDIGITGFKRSFNLASIYHRSGSYLEARTWLRQAMSDSPRQVDAALLLFEWALESGDFREGMVCAESVKSSLGAGEIWTSLRVRLAEALGEPGLEVLFRLNRENPTADGPPTLLARELLARGDERQALPILQSLAAHGSSEAAFHLGVMAVRHGDFRLAHRHTLNAHQLNPSHEQTKDQLAKLEALLVA